MDDVNMPVDGESTDETVTPDTTEETMEVAEEATPDADTTVEEDESSVM